MVINNPAWVKKTSQFIFSRYGRNIPFHPKELLDITDNIGKDKISFHIQSVDKLEETIKIQNSRKTLSTSRNKMLYTYRWKGPNEQDPKKNIVLKLKGSLIFGQAFDMWSAPDEKGYRWVEITNLDWPVRNIFENVLNDIDNWKNQNATELEPFYLEQESKIKSTNKEFNKQKQIKIKDYFDVVSKSLIKNKKEIKELLLKEYSNKTVIVSGKGYDEFLISNFKIVSVFIPNSSKLVTPEQIEGFELKVDNNKNSFYKLEN